MQITTTSFAEVVVVRPVGRIDHTNSATLESALHPLIEQAGANHGSVVLDLSDVEYISSVGLRVLMVAAKQMREQTAQLLVTTLQPVVAEIFAISRFNRILTVTATLSDALALCSPAAREQHRAMGPGSAP